MAIFGKRPIVFGTPYTFRWLSPLGTPSVLRWLSPLGIVLALCLGAVRAEAFEIKGKISLAPPWPEAQAVAVQKDQTTCGVDQISEILLVSKQGFLQNTVVSLEGDFPKQTQTLASLPILNQQACRFDPHILLVPQDQPFLIGNGDRISHDVRAFGGSQMLFRFEMKFLERPVEKVFNQPGVHVIRCGLHPWMHAFVVSTEHPYYAVSDAQGQFQMREVPAGEYTLKIWHETLGEKKIPLALTQSIEDFNYTFSSVNTEVG